MEEVILRYTISPPLKTYNYSAGAMSLVCSNVENGYLWCVGEFLRIKWRFSWNNLDFTLRKFKKWSCLTVKNLKFSNIKSDFTSCIEQNLRNGNYVYLKVNEFYIPNRKSYMLKNFIHDIFVIGFNKDSEIFYTLAFNDSNKFTETSISYSFLEKAYKSCYPRRNIIILGVEKKPCKLIDVNNINLQLKRNLRYNSFFVFFPLMHHIEKCIKHKADIDMRSINIFTEHKKILQECEKYYLGGHEINNLYEGAINLKLLCMKYNAKKDIFVAKRIKKKIKMLKQQEALMLKKCLNIVC